MSGTERIFLLRSTVVAYLSIVLALLAVVLIGVWGAYRDLADIRTSTLQAEISRLRSHGIRTVGRVENELERLGPGSKLSMLEHSVWLERFWRQVIPRERQRLYAAVVDSNGLVIMHSDSSLIDRPIESNWKGDAVVEAGDDVFETRSSALSGGQRAFDIVTPIETLDRQVGEYHSGFDYDWLDGHVTEMQRRTRNRWGVIIGSIVGVVLVSTISLRHITKRAATLQQTISMAHVKQLSDLGRLVGALAHEIRNPLNAIRLNLHTICRVLEGNASLPPEEVKQVLQESNREIERLSELMKTMLGYARPDQANIENVDLNAEMESMNRLIAPIMQRDAIDFSVSTPESAVHTRIDPDRFRQILLNLVNNAKDASGKGGTVSLALVARDEVAEITVQDNGPGVLESERERIFEPFYSTKATGTGLGLALVKRFVEEAGGSVMCCDGRASGACFRVVLPRESVEVLVQPLRHCDHEFQTDDSGC